MLTRFVFHTPGHRSSRNAPQLKLWLDDCSTCELWTAFSPCSGTGRSKMLYIICRCNSPLNVRDYYLINLGRIHPGLQSEYTMQCVNREKDVNQSPRSFCFRFWSKRHSTRKLGSWWLFWLVSPSAFEAITFMGCEVQTIPVEMCNCKSGKEVQWMSKPASL